MNWNRKDLLGLRELSVDEINFVLETADAFKQVGAREIKKVPALRGKTLVNFFVEPSTRTRTSFELAAFRLSADVINIAVSTSSLTKGETLKDTARNLEALHADILVLRHSSAGAPQFLAQRLKSSVINAGDGAHEHPTQGLLDIYTIREKRGKIAGLPICDLLGGPVRQDFASMYFVPGSDNVEEMVELAADGCKRGFNTIYYKVGADEERDTALVIKTRERIGSAPRLRIDANESWTAGLVNEWMRFPFGRHDDQVDAMSQYLDWFTERSRINVIAGAASSFEDRLARHMLGPPLRKGEHPMRRRNGARLTRGWF